MTKVTHLLMAFITLWSVAAAQSPQQGQLKKPDPASQVVTHPDQDDDPLFKNIYRDFYNSYKLGPGDEIAVRVFGQPDYSIERTKISALGRIYHPLLGDIDISGLTIPQLTKKMTDDLSEYVINPKVSISLVEAASARVGVLGEVRSGGGVVVMTRPMTILDAITAVGGFADTGKKSNVTLLRRDPTGNLRTMRVDMKRILEGKSQATENLQLQAGDTVIVHGNAKKTLGTIMTLAGFTNFLGWLIYR
ncbi:MAG TPA: polysaccharide biosynthesis/export family protein [Blastocatellia bacterium]|nr:polysaccharide biosynthesis/export family protein [Blastocatellia bacterium]